MYNRLQIVKALTNPGPDSSNRVALQIELGDGSSQQQQRDENTRRAPSYRRQIYTDPLMINYANQEMQLRNQKSLNGHGHPQRVNSHVKQQLNGHSTTDLNGNAGLNGHAQPFTGGSTYVVQITDGLKMRIQSEQQIASTNLLLNDALTRHMTDRILEQRVGELCRTVNSRVTAGFRLRCFQ